MNDGYDRTLLQRLGAAGQAGSGAGLHWASQEQPAWWIERGSVDVFLVAAGGSGPRHHLLQVPAGRLLLLPPALAPSGEALAVLPAPDAAWRRIERAALQALLDELEPAAAAMLLAPLEEALAQAGGAPCAAGPGAHGALAAIETQLAAALAAAARLRQQQEAAELARLQRQRELGGQAMADALGGFVSLFHGEEARATPASEADTLLAACRLVGAAGGISFRAAPPPLPGASSRDPVQDIAQASGVRTRVVVLKGDWTRHDNGPLLARQAADGAPLALLPQRSGGYLAVDPRTGQRSAVTPQSARALQPQAYSFYASLPARPLALGDLLRFMARGMRPDLLTVAAVGLGSALLGMGIPLASGYLFDSVFPASDRSQMVQVVAILFVASLVTLLLEATRALAMLRIEGKAGSDLQAAVWDRVLALPVPFFRAFTAGDLANRITGINEIRQALSGTVLTSLVSSIFSVLNVGLLFYYSVPLALLAVALVALALAVNGALGYASARLRRATAEVTGQVAGMVLEYLGGIAKLRITGAEARAFANWAASFGRQKRLAMRAGRLANGSTTFNAAFPLLANALIYACIWQVLAGSAPATLSTGDFIAFSAAWSMFLASALTLVRLWIDLLPLVSTYERTVPILQAAPEVDQQRADCGVLSGAIELSHVRFAYAPDGPAILDDVSLSIAPGEFVALVGASGSGKSTLLRLLLGFERPGQGGVYYDGHNLEEIDVGAVRRQLGVVLQSGKLMSGDIFRNIIGSHHLTIDDAWAAARACGLEQDIAGMPMGMHTQLSDGAGTLSGGQRQRLLIARAIVNRPCIVLFDEATSALDNRSQAIVSASLEQLRATRVVIAHRLSTIINADRIYVLDQGKIVQSGTYQQLLAEPGLFAELARRQLA